MEIERIRTLRGPNLWSRNTAIEVLLRCEAGETSLASLQGVETRLRARFSDLGTIRSPACGAAPSMADLFACTALDLQAKAGCPVSFTSVKHTNTPGVSFVVVEYTEEAVGRRAIGFAEALCNAALHDAPFDLVAALAELRELDEDLRLGPSTGAIVQAVQARGIPFIRLTEGSLVQFGWGAKRRRIQAAEVDASSAIAESIAQDKDLTKRLLADTGVPVPQGRPVDDVEDAWSLMQELGCAVVVKPRDGNQGKGITVDVRTREQLESAMTAALAHGSDVLVERYVTGHDFRLLVVGDTLVAAARRDPPQVCGDGVQTVRELVADVNRDPRRGDGHATSLTRIRLDDIAVATLARQGYSPESVPGKGELVVLRNNANLSTGGTATDVTHEVHPELAMRAVEAARTVGLDICGIDIVARTVASPLEVTQGAIVEVNAAPGLRMHLSPSYGRPRPIGERIADILFAPGDRGRIPVVAVTGVNGKTTTTRLIAHLLERSGLRVGMTLTDGVFACGRQIDSGDCSGPKSARKVLMHPEVQAAVFETARGGILREGLAFDRCRVAVVTNVGAGDHLGMNHIDTVEDLARVKQVIVQNVSEDGHAVLNADDPLVAAMASQCPGKVIFFARDRLNGVLAEHHAQGGRVIYRDGDAIVMAERAQVQRIGLAGVPITLGGSVGFQVENTMAAVGAAWALEIDLARISHGLAGFVSDARHTPGRFNHFRHRGSTVIADYGHNPDAIAALIAAVETMPARRRSVVISGAGDRRDEDIRRQSELLGDAFDEIILYEDQCQRGRADGEVIAILRSGLANARRARRVEEIRGEFLAIDTALERLGQEDLCLILIDQVEEALAHIERRICA